MQEVKKCQNIPLPDRFPPIAWKIFLLYFLVFLCNNKFMEEIVSSNSPNQNVTNISHKSNRIGIVKIFIALLPLYVFIFAIFLAYTLVAQGKAETNQLISLLKIISPFDFIITIIVVIEFYYFLKIIRKN